MKVDKEEKMKIAQLVVEKTFSILEDFKKKIFECSLTFKIKQFGVL
jgi:hypothetical protein